MSIIDNDDGQNKIINIIVISLSFIVLAGLLIGLGSTTFKQVNEKQLMPNSPIQQPPISSLKSPEELTLNLGSICMETDYASTCKSLLASVSNGMKNATIKDYAKAAIGITIQQMNEAKQLSERLVKKQTIGNDYQAINDCIEMITLAVYDLEEAFSAAASHEKYYKQSLGEMKNWLSAVISYQEVCLEGITETSETKWIMQDVMKNPKQTAAISLALIDYANSKHDNQTARRLMLDYPFWFSSVKRMVLEGASLKPDAVVARDGSGQFRSIGDALKAYKLNGKGWYVIYVKSGEYNEHVLISREQKNVYMYGDGFDKTVIYGSMHTTDGFPAYRSATVAVLGEGFVCKSIGIQNRATSEKETAAVALRIQADKSSIFKCKIQESLRSLYALAHRQFYRQCIISGTQDFIYGDSSTIIQQSTILITKPHAPPSRASSVIVQGRTVRKQTTGFVLDSCRIVEERECFVSSTRLGCLSYLGHAGGEYSRIVIMRSNIGDGISPEGWTVRDSNSSRRMKVEFREFENSGPGANTSKRVKWDGFQVIRSQSQANQFNVSNFIQGNMWLPRT